MVAIGEQAQPPIDIDIGSLRFSLTWVVRSNLLREDDVKDALYLTVIVVLGLLALPTIGSSSDELPFEAEYGEKGSMIRTTDDLIDYVILLEEELENTIAGLEECEFERPEVQLDPPSRYDF